MSASVVASVVGIAAGINALSNSGGGGSGTSASTYDPYSPYRAGNAQQLNNVLTHPEAAYSSPGFASQLQQGMNTVNAGMAATGQVSSGNQQIALQNLGMNQAGNYYQQMISNLAQMSGASASPLYGAQSAYNAQQTAQQNQYAGVGRIVGGLGKLYNSYNSGSPSNDPNLNSGWSADSNYTNTDSVVYQPTTYW
jgi:hypothetical protein